jgi:hypothetical protein
LEQNLRRARLLNEEQEQKRAAEETARNARLVQVGALRRRNTNRFAIAIVVLLFVLGPAAEWLFKTESLLFIVGAAVGVLLGYLLTLPD